MSRLKSSLPWLFAVFCGVVLAAETGLMHRERIRAKKAVAALRQKMQERDRLRQQSPAPSAENERAIATALSDAAHTLAALRAAFGGTQEAAAVPGGSVEAFFELNRFAEEIKRRAAEAQVVVRPTERFGFARYTNEGPPAALLPLVHRQRIAATGLITALLAARPLALLAFKREQPGPSTDKPAQSGEDCFALPRDLSLRQPGLVDTDAFQLEFTGQTPVLRQFLNTLAGSPQAAVVRMVEVEPYNRKASPPGPADLHAGAVHRPQITKFTVTIEIPLLASTGNAP